MSDTETSLSPPHKEWDLSTSLMSRYIALMSGVKKLELRLGVQPEFDRWRDMVLEEVERSKRGSNA